MCDLEDPSAGLFDEEEVQERERIARIAGLKEALGICKKLDDENWFAEYDTHDCCERIQLAISSLESTHPKDK